MGLTLTHYIYVGFTILLIAAVIRGKDITLTGLTGIIAVAFFYSLNLGTALSTVCKAGLEAIWLASTLNIFGQ